MRVKRHFEERPWGNFETFTPDGTPSKFESTKIITVNPNSELSLQYHNHRDEFFKILSGTGKVRIGDEVHNVKKGDELFIKKKQLHQVTTEEGELIILEISFDNFDENDIVRISDRYGRV